jgi:hypothetical protein
MAKKSTKVVAAQWQLAILGRLYEHNAFPTDEDCNQAALGTGLYVWFDSLNLNFLRLCACFCDPYFFSSGSSKENDLDQGLVRSAEVSGSERILCTGYEEGTDDSDSHATRCSVRPSPTTTG